MSYTEACEKLYVDHKLLTAHCEGLEKVLEDNLIYIKELEELIFELTGQRMTPEHFVGKTNV